jgi:hypothetical protein
MLEQVRAAQRAWPKVAEALEALQPDTKLLTDIVSYVLDLTCAEIATRRAAKLYEEIYGLANPIS